MAERDSSSYREKYLQALKEQDRLEKQFALQSDVLKKTMLQLGVAASGMDQQLDANVLRLREVMRGGSGAQAVDQMNKVQEAVVQFEQQRSAEHQKVAQQMKALVLLSAIIIESSMKREKAC